MKQDWTRSPQPPDKPSSQEQQRKGHTQRRGGSADERENVDLDAPGYSPRRPPPDSGSDTGIKKNRG